MAQRTFWNMLGMFRITTWIQYAFLFIRLYGCLCVCVCWEGGLWGCYLLTTLRKKRMHGYHETLWSNMVQGAIDQFHKFNNASVSYPTVLHSRQKCAHFCSEWRILWHVTGAFGNLRVRSIGNICEAQSASLRATRFHAPQTMGGIGLHSRCASCFAKRNRVIDNSSFLSHTILDSSTLA